MNCFRCGKIATVAMEDAELPLCQDCNSWIVEEGSHGQEVLRGLILSYIGRYRGK